ncbi:MAG: transketolase [Candidatus Omnitrophica bacterium]|nr:transketolase [Candidatus Omnitrophota bacterium]
MKKFIKEIIMVAANTGEGHIPSALSVLDILWILYDRVLNIYPRDPNHPDRDRFILSKGHASLGLYAILSEKGFFDKSLMNTFGKYDSILGGHLDRNKVPGVEASTGSLGHGFPMGVGIALALKIKKSSSRVFTVIGDGECNEGSVWEAALLAAHHKLNNLICIIDYNHSTDRALNIGDLAIKFKAFGWMSCEINGHDHEQIYNALRDTPKDKPLAVVANTIKGKGCKMMENNPAWHHRSPTKDELMRILESLE